MLNYSAALRHIEKNAAKNMLTHADLFRLHAIIAGQVLDHRGNLQPSTFMSPDDRG